MAFSLAVVRVSIGVVGGDGCVLGKGAGVLQAPAERRADDAAAVPPLDDRRVLFALTPLLVFCPDPLRQPTRHGPECLGWGEGGKGGSEEGGAKTFSQPVLVSPR